MPRKRLGFRRIVSRDSKRYWYWLREDGRVFRGHSGESGHFCLPKKRGRKREELEDVDIAGSPKELSGSYIDFLREYENSPRRYQTVRSLLKEMFG